MGVILKPVITEKMTDKGEKLNQFGFIVDNSANKLQIKEEVEELYGVQVLSVNTMNYSGKKKSRNTKSGVISGSIVSTYSVKTGVEVTVSNSGGGAGSTQAANEGKINATVIIFNILMLSSAWQRNF